MENKYSSVVMILVLVVMAAIGGEASDLSCEQKCRSACAGGKGFVHLPECYIDCVRKCKDIPPTIETSRDGGMKA
ncbi:hypothetical protein AtNW77_Chr5g0149771 [Arabidopsis thaliana]|uniref:Plant thionin family protein n=2 Tax=Arabidopsis TaxID=3701 RepID=A0A178UPQ5_ARATH|nr:hypothetical protein ISN45_At05g059260 [Arabidopsis thaliana x Arabidopsis arenosa]OAO95104.1 hypothetical protein AXX17_AT5G62650 [Arabidopsis thaliana]